MINIQLLHQSIDTIEKKPYLVNNQLTNVNVPGKGHNLILKLKDLRIVTLEIPTAQDYLSISASIEQLSTLKDPKCLYAFYYRPIYQHYLENGFSIFRCVQILPYGHMAFNNQFIDRLFFFLADQKQSFLNYLLVTNGEYQMLTKRMKYVLVIVAN